MLGQKSSTKARNRNPSATTLATAFATWERVWVWGLRAWWAALPFTAGPLLADGLHNTSSIWRTTASLGLWTIWAVVLLGSLLPHPKTLLLIRLALPTAVVALVWAVIGSAVWLDVLPAMTITATAATAALSAPVGHFYVNGISYGDEIRLMLRPPAVIVMGVIPIAAIMSIGGLAAGPLLLAAERWILGAAITLVGIPLVAVSTRSLYALTQRWLVFVPAGVVIHDHLAVQDPLLLRRRVIASFAAAPQNSTATDLSQGAAGLILQVSANQAISLLLPSEPTWARRKLQLRLKNPSQLKDPTHSCQIHTEALLIAPSRPGLAIQLAQKRLVGNNSPAI